MAGGGGGNPGTHAARERSGAAGEDTLARRDL
jgi:hypothetical protein